MNSIIDLRNLVINETHLQSIGQTHWSSPSNIALVKYWGKFGDQLPCNPSISFTLERSRSFLKLQWRGRTYLKDNGPEVDFVFEGQDNPKFAQKIQKLLAKFSQEELPFLKYFDFSIEASNTFPHSSGIASSASSMSALACCLGAMVEDIFHVRVDAKLLSRWARLGSGSAARSVFEKVAIWGEWKTSLPDFSTLAQQSHNDFAIEVKDFHPVFDQYQDAILIVDEGEKPVSSRDGHALMNHHPHAQARFARAHRHLDQLMQILREGDLFQFCQIVEAEALELHGLMMTSTPPYILMRPQTLELIQRIQAWRESSQIPACFTLDAGANVHLLYPFHFKAQVEKFIEDQCRPLCAQRRVIFDQMGKGPRAEELF